MALPALRFLPLALLLAPAVVLASAAAAPERQRVAPAQADGAVHTLRQIPEACARLEGGFTADPAQPYRLQVVKTRPDCQPRAAFISARAAQPSVAAGWILNELITVPSAACAGVSAILQVWRRPGATSLARDGQGQGRVYLEQARQQAGAGQLAALPAYSARLQVQGSCQPRP
jgi:hypothetical protein